MSIKKHKTASKVISVLVSITTVGWLSGVAALAPFAAHAQTDTAALIADLQAKIAALQVQLTALSAPATGAKCTFSRSLTVGARGDDVTCLQNYLTGTSHYSYSGGATGYFGNVTKGAVAAWQAANGVSPAVGYFGSISRAKYNSLVVAAPAALVPAPAPGPTPAVVPAATGTLRVEAGTHPASSLFPTNSTRVPFTVLKFTAPAGQDVTVNSLTVERTGLASDTAFSGVVALDEQGTQLGVAKTLNSAHQANLSEKFIVSGGTTRTITLAGNAQTSNNSLGGQIGYVSLVSVAHTASSLVGTLPITGTGHTVNETLTIGSVTMLRGATDPGSSQTKEVGTTGYTFSSVKVTAGSAEKVFLRSIRWNQTGSVGSGDIKNVKTYVDGVAYDIVVSSDSKYYTSTFGDNNGRGILMDKGFSKELSIKGDVEGGSGRTIDFDLAKRTDIGLIGESYGYGITPPATGTSDPTDDTAAFSNVEDPWYDAGQVTVSAGSIQISTSNSAPAQNIAINLANQPLGAFTVDVKGEAISVGRMGFNITLGSEGANDDVDDITNVIVVDENGLVVAGPADGTAADSANTTGSGDGSVVFTDTVTFQPGLKNYILKGKIGVDIDNNVTIIASTTPSADFATVRGLITGNTITPSPTSALTFSTMTVKTGSLAISASNVPIAQTVIANTKGFEFARYVLDATASGEDIRLTTIPLAYGFEANGTAGAATDLTNCQIHDGSVSVTTGSNVKNPTAAASDTSFTFDGTGLIVSKGTSKTIGLTCDVKGGASVGYYWGLDSAQTTYTGATGLTSGQTIVETMTESDGQKMTAASGGTFSAALDAGSPGYKVISAGSTGVELAKIRFSASNEDVDLKQVALQITGAGSSTGDGIGTTTAAAFVGRKVTLWSGATQVGEATFSLIQGISSATQNFFATSSTISGFRIPRDGAKVLTIKGDIAAVTTSGPLTQSGVLLAVDYDGGNTGLNGTYGTGVSSGTTLSPTGADTASTGARIMKAYPELSYIALSTAEKVLAAGTKADKLLYKFSVKAVGGDVALYKMTFQVSSSTQSGAAGTTSLLSLYAFTDSTFSSADTTFSPNGLLNDEQSFCADVVPANVLMAGTGANGSQNAVGLCGTAAGRIDGTTFPTAIYMDREAGSAHAGTTTYIVPSGVTRYFKLEATVTGVRSSGQENLQIALQGDAAYPRPANLGGMVGSATLASQNRITNMFNSTTTDRDDNDDFIWSPISTSSTNAIDDLDFTNGYLLPGLPTTNMTIETLTTSN